MFETAGRAGVVTLDRPKALNSLSEAMVRSLKEALEEWRRDDRVERVVLKAEGKAFCAGGDVLDVYARRAGAVDFFGVEYQTDLLTGLYEKPIVALLDGVCMGGGVGISGHGSHRVATDNLVFAMPEVGIGLFPDVGASHILSRLPGESGMWLALTGSRVGRDEAAALGIVTHPIDAGRLGDALDRAVHARGLDGALDELVVKTAPRDDEAAKMIDAAFAGDDIMMMLERLNEAAADSELAAKAVKAIGQKSPTSLMITVRQLREATEKSLTECLATDFRIVSRVLEGPDLYEGIRALLVDKDNAPRWDPARLDQVDPDEIAVYFAVPPHGDLDLSGAAI
ncbi:enoyl-CoA hydratase/isomerase family protein [Acuticoccus mangrovi]|uniref:3-hydroxyisobutyryl-CoA hydrolase n=1 Tax=Acuticoccus mangrovi TaxID=2796142 RepID=A0A934MF19_9HYPH|nr:enoyl-CoA hydratase/isomerase family protein [Acuticoccus mangrovi]